MNINNAINSVKDVIEDNKSTIISGIQHQGVDREIKHVYTSILTPWQEFYSISIHCPRPGERFREAGNTVRGTTIEVYAMEIHIVDAALPQSGDTPQVPYETMHSDFRTVISRIVGLLKDTTVSFSSSGDSFVLVPFQPISVDERTDWFDTSESSYPMLYGVISFEIRSC